LALGYQVLVGRDRVLPNADASLTVKEIKAGGDNEIEVKNLSSQGVIAWVIKEAVVADVDVYAL
tara:strand:+ start:144 stop:335 length:192 start_codon:yes stop_codon:yes gene_type:complete